MRTILVALDGSVLAEQVLSYIPLLARTLHAQVQLLHVVSPVDSYHLFVDQIEVANALGDLSGMQGATPAHAEDVLRQHAEVYLGKVAAQLQSQDVEATYTVRRGAPVEMIVQAAIDAQATLIALATHGYSGLQRWALGSVTDKLVRTTTKPVFVVRGSRVASAAEHTLKCILVPLDGSMLARAALPLATELAAHSQAALVLFSAITPPLDEADNPLRDLARDQAKLHALVQQELEGQDTVIRQQSVAVSTALSFGYPAEAIVDEATERHADLIVMGTHGYGGLQRWMLGSVADKVLRATTTPLLLVRG